MREWDRSTASKHELIAVYKVGNAPHVNNVSLGQYGRSPLENVWTYAGHTSGAARSIQRFSLRAA